MRQLAIQLSQVTHTSLQFYLEMPVRDLIDLGKEVSEVCRAMAP